MCDLFINNLEDFDSIGFYLMAVGFENGASRITNPNLFQDDSKIAISPDFGDPNECMNLN